MFRLLQGWREAAVGSSMTRFVARASAFVFVVLASLVVSVGPASAAPVCAQFAPNSVNWSVINGVTYQDYRLVNYTLPAGTFDVWSSVSVFPVSKTGPGTFSTYIPTNGQLVIEQNGVECASYSNIVPPPGVALPSPNCAPPVPGAQHSQRVAAQPVDAQVWRLYSAYFLRQPQTSGLDYWVSQRASGRSHVSISNFFASSPEFQNRYGNVGSTDFVILVYVNVLCRMPDSDGLGYWSGKLLSGEMTRGELMLYFSEGAEYRNKTNTQFPLA